MTTQADTRLCSTCGIRPAQPGQRKCRECHAEYMRQWRQKRVSVNLTADNYEYLRQRAFTEGGPAAMSRLINRAVDRMRRSDVSRET